MIYDAETGIRIMEKYLGNNIDLTTRLNHSRSVGDFSLKVARKIGERNPELGLDVQLCGFLGYVHDIGYSKDPRTHERVTIKMLKEDGVDTQTANKTMHGFEEEEDYLPRGIEGIILNYCDMSVMDGKKVELRERFDDSKRRMQSNESLEPRDREIISAKIEHAFPRFQRYERIVLTLAEVASVNDF